MSQSNANRADLKLIVNPSVLTQSQDDSQLVSGNPNPVKISCVVNNYNYGQFVCEALRSALDQQRPFDEIIVVDDGSTDDSLARIEREFGRETRIRVISKSNGGQLSSFHAGVEASSGDIIFFLDADDRYHPELTTRVLRQFRLDDRIDFLSVDYHEFGEHASNHRKRRHKQTGYLGCSPISAILKHRWVGNPTSCLAIRASVLAQVLPYPHEDSWRTRADDVLVLGTSIVGACKYHLPEALVDYRLHGNNQFAGQRWHPNDQLRYNLEVNRLVQWYVDKMGYQVQRLGHLLLAEFRTIERPTLHEWHRYAKMTSLTSRSWRERVSQIIKMMRHYRRQSLRPANRDQYRSSPFRTPSREIFSPNDDRQAA